MQETKKPGNPKGQEAAGIRAECEKLADAGDVLRLLNTLQDRAGPGLLMSSMPLIDRCVRRRAASDPEALCDDLFSRILGMAGVLLIKVQLYIGHRLREVEASGGHLLSAMPADLVDEGWLERGERLSYFIGEMAATRARVRHLNELTNRQQARGVQNGQSHDNGRTLAGGPSPAGNGQAAPANGRGRVSPGAYVLP